MKRIIDVLKKILAGLQVIAEYIARGIYLVGNLIEWLGGLLKPVAKRVMTLFGQKR